MNLYGRQFTQKSLNPRIWFWISDSKDNLHENIEIQDLISNLRLQYCCAICPNKFRGVKMSLKIAGLFENRHFWNFRSKELISGGEQMNYGGSKNFNRKYDAPPPSVIIHWRGVNLEHSGYSILLMVADIPLWTPTWKLVFFISNFFLTVFHDVVRKIKTNNNNNNNTFWCSSKD